MDCDKITIFGINFVYDEKVDFSATKSFNLKKVFLLIAFK